MTGLSATTQVTDSGTDDVYAMSIATAGTAGSSYRLCWAHDPAGLGDFNVVVDGFVELVGPDIGDFVCTMGFACMMQVTGYGLMPTSGAVNLLTSGCMMQILWVDFLHFIYPTRNELYQVGFWHQPRIII